MDILNFVKCELKSLNLLERAFYPLIIFFICAVSIFKHDNIIALIGPVCGITYTIFAGKGKIYCYIFGIVSTICYSYFAYMYAFWGQLALNLGYYLPMAFIGIFLWKRNLKKDKLEIKKTRLNIKQRFFYFFVTFMISLLVIIFLQYLKDGASLLDGITTVFSCLGMFLTVKRCVEQWYVWFFVNVCSMFMWVGAYIEGVNCMAIVLKWLIYAVLAIYFLKNWNKELSEN